MAADIFTTLYKVKETLEVTTVKCTSVTSDTANIRNYARVINFNIKKGY